MVLPIVSTVNSSKNDNIPDMDKYLELFVETHRKGLEITHQTMSKAKWENSVDDYSMGLNLTMTELETLPKNLFEEKYKQTILPLSTVAKNMGFQPNWAY